jgi:hypothetical protein
VRTGRRLSWPKVVRSLAVFAPVSPAADFKTYDKTLDDPYDRCHKMHIAVDRGSALKISAMLDNSPMEVVHLKEIEFDETTMFESAIPELDWEFLDQLSDDSSTVVPHKNSAVFVHFI